MTPRPTVIPGSGSDPCRPRVGELEASLERATRGAAALAQDLATLSPDDPHLGRRLKEATRKLRLAGRELAALEWLVAEVDAGLSSQRLAGRPGGESGDGLPPLGVR